MSASAVQTEYSKRLSFGREDGAHEARLHVAKLSLAWLESHGSNFLSEDERSALDKMAHERRRQSFLIGRYCAKKAFLAGGGRAASVSVVSGIFGQPLVRGDAAQGARISIAHTGCWGAALLHADSHPMGIDLESADPGRTEVLRTQATATEKAAAAAILADEPLHLIWLWTAKEALAKALTTGLMTPFELYELTRLRREGAWLAAEFTNFSQYQARTTFVGSMAVSLVYPRRSQLDLEASELASALAGLG